MALTLTSLVTIIPFAVFCSTRELKPVHTKVYSDEHE